jgi:RNA polymerase sigma-70 factor (ECF subfamily)
MTSKEYNRAVDEFSDNIYRFALKHLKNEMTAKDIVQETFTKVWIKHKEVAYEKVKSYLFTTAYHALVDWVKKEGRNGDYEKVEHTSSTEFSISFDLQKILNDALDRLPEIQKTVILLRDYEGYNYAEIAEITNLNESQVKVYIFRGRQTLKEYIKRMELVV